MHRSAWKRSSRKFTARVRRPRAHEDECHQHQKALPPRAAFSETPAPRLLILLLELVPFLGSLHGPLEPCQPLVPHMLPLVRAQRREHLQRSSRVRLTADPHPRPPSARSKVSLAVEELGPTFALRSIFRLD